ncbi:MAG TPA: DUF4830 domain-containing protein [Clostridiales bacterium]|jgi:hypothetical protein|nr:DUF4830 domain-containing protein [Clostridiales bacterium]HBE12820.1 DUF4830 domain-containing protein [Clostridiales bacterium]HCG35318.1 DUF4830 domain-containing protein [Clostridiales bacterium]
MFIYAVKASTLKFAGLLVLSVLALSMAVLLIPEESNIAVGNITLSEKDFKNIESAQDRVQFLKLCGWETEAEAVAVTEVTIPAVFDGIYATYNQLQSEMGLDLTGYKNKTVKRYTYIVTNYTYHGTVYANLLIYDNKVIGGDITSANVDGFQKSLVKNT